MISVENISKTFQKDFWVKPFQALDNVSFNVKEGSLTGFLGANGAGKTTSMKIILGFIKATSGNVSFSSSMGKNRREFLSNIGYVPERPYFYPHLSGLEFCQYMGKINGLKGKDLDDKINYWSERFSIKFALDRKVRSYSKGMLQRIGFVSALIHNPKLLILDEPVAGLDPVGRKEIKDVLKELNNEGKTIFFSSHIVSDIEEICNEVVVLEKGKLLYQGKTSDLVEKHLEGSYEATIRKANIDFKTAKVLDDKSTEAYSIYLIEKEKKEDFLKEIIEKDASLVSFTEVRPSLEEVVYKIGI